MTKSKVCFLTTLRKEINTLSVMQDEGHHLLLTDVTLIREILVFEMAFQVTEGLFDFHLLHKDDHFVFS
jgi:hypothetical protein